MAFGLHRALVRQLGATNVDLDSEAGWVQFALPEATTLDFAKFAETLDSANYELFGMEIVVHAEFAEDAGRPIAIIAGTGQRIGLTGAESWIGKRRIRGAVIDWTLAPKLTLLEPAKATEATETIETTETTGRPGLRDSAP